MNREKQETIDEMRTKDIIKSILAFRESIRLIPCLKFLEVDFRLKVKEFKAARASAIEKSDADMIVGTEKKLLGLMEVREKLTLYFIQKTSENKYILNSKIKIYTNNNIQSKSEFSFSDLIKTIKNYGK